jgi:hypothetical protein
VLVTGARELLDAGEVEERLGELVALGFLPPLDLLPGFGAVGKLAPDTEVASSDRVEDPARPSLDVVGNQRSAPRTTRAA